MIHRIQPHVGTDQWQQIRATRQQQYGGGRNGSGPLDVIVQFRQFKGTLTSRFFEFFIVRADAFRPVIEAKASSKNRTPQAFLKVSRRMRFKA